MNIKGLATVYNIKKVSEKCTSCSVSISSKDKEGKYNNVFLNAMICGKANDKLQYVPVQHGDFMELEGSIVVDSFKGETSLKLLITDYNHYNKK